jgi:hypothetical protein
MIRPVAKTLAVLLGLAALLAVLLLGGMARSHDGPTTGITNGM